MRSAACRRSTSVSCFCECLRLVKFVQSELVWTPPDRRVLCAHRLTSISRPVVTCPSQAKPDDDSSQGNIS
jgi:hypothetical protein